MPQRGKLRVGASAGSGARSGNLSPSGGAVLIASAEPMEALSGRAMAHGVGLALATIASATIASATGHRPPSGGSGRAAAELQPAAPAA